MEKIIETLRNEIENMREYIVELKKANAQPKEIEYWAGKIEGLHIAIKAIKEN